MPNGSKIIEGLKQAIAGDFARVTIEGQVWERIEPEKEPTARAILDWFTRHVLIGPWMFGGKISKDEHGDPQIGLTFVMSENPVQSYTLMVAGNSYDHACLGEIAGAINEARKLLGKPEIAVETNAMLVQKVAE